MRALSLTLIALSCAPPARSAPAATEAQARAASDPSTVSPEPIVVAAEVAPIDDPDCERVTFPAAGASVVIVPGATMTRALSPVVHAACSCTRSGERLQLTALIIPEAGVVTAIAHDNDPANACIQRTLTRHFAPPFALGSDCFDCGAKRLPILRGREPAAAPEPARSKMTYPFTLVHR